MHRLPKDVRKPEFSDFGPFRQRQSIIDIYADISDGMLDVGMTEQDLNCPQISGRLLDQRGFCPAQRVRSIVSRIETDRCDPFVDDLCSTAA